MKSSQPNARSRSKRQPIQRRLLTVLKQSTKTTHTRIVTCGLLVELCYLPVWLSIVWDRTVHGSSYVVLNAAFIYLAFQALWHQRHQLQQTTAFEDDRLSGHALIVGGVAVFPFCLSSASLQAFVAALILAGIALSTWGIRFFKQNPLTAVLLLASVYPDFSFLVVQIWKFVTPPNLLENFMAWSGGVGLRAIGQPAIAKGTFLSLPQGAVEVKFACNGFDMAFTLAATGFILGVLFKQRWLTTVKLMMLGIGLALLLNIPRIMLLTIAAVYWGKDAFGFWHGPIGGQLFSALLLTVYYYGVIGFLNKSIKKSPKKSSA